MPGVWSYLFTLHVFSKIISSRKNLVNSSPCSIQGYPALFMLYFIYKNKSMEVFATVIFIIMFVVQISCSLEKILKALFSHNQLSFKKARCVLPYSNSKPLQIMLQWTLL